MQKTETSPDYDSVDPPELPNGWRWRIGELNPGHYTWWFGTTYIRGGDLVAPGRTGGFEGEVYWDKGGDGKHHVQIYPFKGIRRDGDPLVSAYPAKFGRYDSMQEALDAVPELIKELKQERGAT